MAPKNAKGSSKKQKELESDPGYIAKRERNNEAVRKSREKSKQKSEQTMKRVKKLREDNKLLEGKIEEQKKTKKFLKDLFLQQTTNKMEQPSKEQWDLINNTDSSEESDHDSESAMDSDEDSNLGSPTYSTTSSTKGNKR
ncbi:CLUMA_CG009649, isoform A [Clunio marinus]|uniref:CLUMA_CG009649, isoform A n=1 Tax=Clunio marinus TaxID=568069 RepID=A0A1J1IB69_9DIPT|nr:CLUMA_CG009649, isoform A [Clunio marinus]